MHVNFQLMAISIWNFNRMNSNWSEGIVSFSRNVCTIPCTLSIVYATNGYRICITDCMSINMPNNNTNAMDQQCDNVHLLDGVRAIKVCLKPHSHQWCAIWKACRLSPLAAADISISFNASYISPNEAYGWLATYVFNTRHALIHLYQMTSNKSISTDADKTDTIYVRFNLYW